MAAEPYAWWSSLRHGGLLIAPARGRYDVLQIMRGASQYRVTRLHLGAQFAGRLGDGSV